MENIINLPKLQWLSELTGRSKVFRGDSQIVEFLSKVAMKSVENGFGPFAAAVFDISGNLVAVNVNQVTSLWDPLAHAETVVLREALHIVQESSPTKLELSGFTLYSTGEPCVGCSGAIYLFAPSRVVWCIPRDDIEANSRFSEGPRCANFWSDTLRARGISVHEKVGFSQESLKPLIVFEDHVQAGRAIPYLQEKPRRVFIGLSANVGDLVPTIEAAILRIGRDISPVVQRSSLYATVPMVLSGTDPSSQSDYINAMVEIVTEIPPREILRRLFAIENDLGRVRTQGERWEPRTIDLDIIYAGDSVLNAFDLTVPHPGAHLRDFVLVPIHEIAPEIHHPIFGKTSNELLADLEAKHAPLFVRDKLSH